MHSFVLQPIGIVRSSLKRRDEAPAQGFEGAPDAWLEILPDFRQGLEGIQAGRWLLVLTWLHLAERDTLIVHPRGDPRNPLRGVFSTCSPDRPNPIGLHLVQVRQVAVGGLLLVGPLEAVDGTPILDIKPHIEGFSDSAHAGSAQRQTT